MKNKIGFTLMEMMVALFLVSIIMVGIGVAFTMSLRQFGILQDNQSGNLRALMAMKMIERQLSSVACRSQAPPDCTANVLNLVRFPTPGLSGNTLVGRIQTEGGGDECFKFQYFPSESKIRYCSVPVVGAFLNCCDATNGLVVANEIVNGFTSMFRRDVASTPTQTTIRVTVVASQGTEGVDDLGSPINRTKTYQSTFTIDYGN